MLSFKIIPSRAVYRQCQSKSIQRVLLSTSISRSNNAQEIEKVKHLLETKMSEIRDAEAKRQIEDQKPKLSDFSRPIVSTLIIGSIAYLSFHWVWWYLEKEEREKELKTKEEELAKIAPVRDSTEVNKKSWFRFWR
ncbi:hypothetical protein BN7_1315 [Wickerhamomyces ciferrii]|uniref:Inner membrane assembly complex subunit 17 n=1 Tax=Wickerhamomyces ciferrii (strain ATCC 14091 / BCRC 22168 / CBS 111 / JCM 3599 / NBRC 0793 / NRRL Y-1031 F-60-10) TaxID=1206466 RepID=K0KFV0_WICCF|nr:uncharacterized protein BN7_1315 [Wickerhamomyces ciferrii]CCH41776.1 hypothetical protein BN7_1315 [Wickerhamomyces ciferrii]